MTIKDNTDTSSSDFIDIPVTTPVPVSPASTSSPGVSMTASGLDDPIVSALTKRTADLSLSIVNPETLATKLRESLIIIAGASAVSYHIGLAYDGKNIKVEIAHLSPHLIVKLTADMQSADIGLTYQTKNPREDGMSLLG